MEKNNDFIDITDIEIDDNDLDKLADKIVKILKEMKDDE